jgi:Uncharacterised nucleotidyltransferase
MSAVWTLIDLLAGRRDPATLDDRAWEAVISVARAEVLVATLAERLAEADLPPAVAALFADLRAAMRVQQTLALWEAEMARRALEPAGVRFVLLKGTAYAAAGLPCAAGRQIGDLDILVAREDLDRAETALLAAGWEWVKPDPYDDAYYRNHMHELPPLIHKDRDRMIDVHHTILPLTHRARPDAAALLKRAEVLPLPTDFACVYSDSPAEYGPVDPGVLTNGQWVLGPYDMVVHCVAHVMADGDLAGGLRNLWDFHLLTQEMERRSGGKYWKDLAGYAGEHRLYRELLRAARLAHYLFGSRERRVVCRDQSCTRPPTATDRLFLRALTARDDWGRPTRPFTRLLFTIRSHWLRMPPLMLARHLLVKWRRGQKLIMTNNHSS